MKHTIPEIAIHLRANSIEIIWYFMEKNKSKYKKYLLWFFLSVYKKQKASVFLAESKIDKILSNNLYNSKYIYYNYTRNEK